MTASRGRFPTGSEAATNASAWEQIENRKATTISAAAPTRGWEVSAVKAPAGTSPFTVAAASAPRTRVGPVRDSSVPTASARKDPRRRRSPATEVAWSCRCPSPALVGRSEEHTSELQSRENLVCRLLLEKKKTKIITNVLKAKRKKRNIY